LTQVRITRLDAVMEGEPREFDTGEVQVLVIKLGGRIYCLAAKCTHAGAPLADGNISGDTLTCPWHGSMFKITDGSVLRGPAEKPLRTYQPVVQGDYLYVDV